MMPLSKKVWVDPPSGWKYGFPKKWNQQGTSKEWLLKEGYPQEEMDAHGKAFYIRCWETEE